jgi:predicted transcriptional regulator
MEVSGMAIEKPEETKRRIEVESIEEAYALGRKHMREDIAVSDADKADFTTIGKLAGLDFTRMTAEMAIYVTLYQVKQSKEYRKAGMTWEQFCLKAGKTVRNVDRILADFNPVIKELSANLSEILGMPMSKVRYLGQSLLENSATVSENALVIGDQKIEMVPENMEEIEAAIDVLKEEREREIEKHVKEVERLKKRVENGVEEETKNLTVERDALVKELTRLKVFDPAEKDLSWSVQQMKEISKTGLLFVSLIQKFILDDRLDGEFVLQAEVMKWQDICRNALDNLRHDWNERFINEFRSEP